MYQLTDSSRIDAFPVPFRMGFNTYLNNILEIQDKNMSQIILPSPLISGTPIANKSLGATKNITSLAKAVSFVILNGLRDIYSMVQGSRKISYD